MLRPFLFGSGVAAIKSASIYATHVDQKLDDWLSVDFDIEVDVPTNWTIILQMPKYPDGSSLIKDCKVSDGLSFTPIIEGDIGIPTEIKSIDCTGEDYDVMKIFVGGYFEMQAGYYFQCNIYPVSYKSMEEVEALGTFTIITGDDKYNKFEEKSGIPIKVMEREDLGAAFNIQISLLAILALLILNY